MFFPDRAGSWRITVKDGRGHAVEHIISFGEARTVGEDETPVPDQPADPVRDEEDAPALTRLQAAVVGAAVIFGLFGVLALIKSRQRAGA
jgi:hypothetical protein